MAPTLCLTPLIHPHSGTSSTCVNWVGQRKLELLYPDRCDTLVMLVPSMQIISYTIIARECYLTCVHADDDSTLPSHRHTTYLGHIWPKNVASITLGRCIRCGCLCSDSELAYLVSISSDLSCCSMWLLHHPRISISLLE